MSWKLWTSSQMEGEKSVPLKGTSGASVDGVPVSLHQRCVELAAVKCCCRHKRRRRARKLSANFIPCGLDCAVLASNKYQCSWDKLTMQQQANMISDALAPDRLLFNPQSKTMQRWNAAVTAALVFVAIVTPYEVAFLAPEVNWLLFMNRFIDGIFIVDMVLQFLTAVKIRVKLGASRSRRESGWIRNRGEIAKRYLRGWFSLDVLSLIPFDFLSVYMAGNAIVKHLVSFRAIRIVRLLKILKVLKMSRTISQLQIYFSISFSKLILLKLSLRLVVLAHWMACIWGLTGKLLGTRFECTEDGEVVIDPELVNATTVGVSWITDYLVKDEPTHDSPCNPAHLYACSLYWAIMTISSIGYGGIVPVRFEEYLISCMLQLAGATLWAYTIGTAFGALRGMDPERIQFESSMDSLNYMMAETHQPLATRHALRKHFHKGRQQQWSGHYRQLKNLMSPHLSGEVALHDAGRWLKHVWYLDRCDKRLAVQLAANLRCLLYAPREKFPVGQALYIMKKGACAQAGRVLTTGSVWGIDMILESKVLQERRPAIALTYAEVLSLSRNVLLGLVARYPREQKRIRRAVVTFAVMRGIIHHARCFQLQRMLSSNGGVGSAVLANYLLVYSQDGDQSEEDSGDGELPRAAVSHSSSSLGTQVSPPRSSPRPPAANVEAVDCAGESARLGCRRSLTPPTGVTGLRDAARAAEKRPSPLVVLNSSPERRGSVSCQANLSNAGMKLPKTSKTFVRTSVQHIFKQQYKHPQQPWVLNSRHAVDRFAEATAAALKQRLQDRLEYKDSEDNLVQFAVIGTQLVMSVNRQRRAGPSDDTSGVVNRLTWRQKSGWGGDVRDQYGIGGAIPKDQLHPLKNLAIKARVENNIPTVDIDATRCRSFKLAPSTNNAVRAVRFEIES